MVDSSDILRGKVLIVDDQEANVLLLERMLRGAGYDCVTSTTDPTEVRELHLENRYDLILLDLMMPIMDGLQVMEGLREVQSDGYLPVLVITAQSGQKLDALRAGAMDFVSKPFDLAEVLVRVHNMLEVRLLDRELHNQNDVLERRVQERTSDLREAQRIGHFGSFDWDARTDTIVWSEEYYRIHGFDPKQGPPTYEEHLKAYGPESAARLDAAVKTSMQTGEPYVLDLEQACPDGTRRWATARGEVKRDANDKIVGLRGTAQDITERKTAEESIRKLNRIYAVLSGINEAIVHLLEPQALFEEACRVAVEDGGFIAAWVGLVDPADNRVRVAAQWGATEGYLDDIEIIVGHETLGCGPTGVGISERRRVVSQDIDHDPAMAPWRDNALRHGYRSCASLPLIVGDEGVGAFSMYADAPDFFDEEQLKLLDELAADISLAMEFAGVEKRRRQGEVDLEQSGVLLAELLEEREHNLEQLARSFSSLIEVLCQVVEMRDPYTAGHQRRVSELSVRISEEMGMPTEQVEEIRVAALIHDVGKMVVPAEILTKPGKLSHSEFELIKDHSEAGYRIIESAHMEGSAAETVFQHHERCDGSGYPRGLMAEQLLPNAKVLMVADVVEAMTSHRPYRAALGMDAALEEIEGGAGRLYDSEVCKACVAVCRDGGFAFSA